MPVMNGLDAARAIRAMDREDCRQIPIIAMSANAFDEDLKKSVECGMKNLPTFPKNTALPAMYLNYEPGSLARAEVRWTYSQAAGLQDHRLR